MRLRSFQTRILLLFLGLFLLAQTLTIYIVNRTSLRSITETVGNQLDASGQAFRRIWAERTQGLLAATYPVSRDFAFIRTVSDGDPSTIRSGLLSLRNRVGADVLTLVADDEELLVLADTANMELSGKPFHAPALVEGAMESLAGEYSNTAVTLVGDRLCRHVIFPLLSPLPSAWFRAGYHLTDDSAAELGEMVLTDVSFILRKDGNWQIPASSLDEATRSDLLKALTGWEQVPGMSGEIQLLGKPYLALVGDIDPSTGTYVILQRSLHEALAPFRILAMQLLLVSAIGILLTALGAIQIARNISRPVLALAKSAKQVGQGEYDVRVAVDQTDEIGELATAFNDMAAGLREREKMRILLGKVVSPTIARELLKRKEVVLGGEEREVTVLFCDLRSFTTMSEGRTPEQVVAVLNRFLTRMSGIIDDHSGVVDKYVGDQIMAIFGAPVSSGHDADDALCAALDMVAGLATLNEELVAEGLPQLRAGIGINSGAAVAGNMGSPNRLSYTVIGDNVNVAARLESQTKDEQFGATIIVSDQTLMRAEGQYKTRSLGAISVKGRKEAVAAYALDGYND